MFYPMRGAAIPRRRYVSPHALPAYGLLNALDRPELLRVSDVSQSGTAPQPTGSTGISPFRWIAGQVGLLDILGDTTGPLNTAALEGTNDAVRSVSRYTGLADAPHPQSWYPQASATASDDGLLDVGEYALRSIGQGFKDLWTGYLIGASGIYNTAGNAVGLLNDLNDVLTETTGIGHMSEGTFSKDFEDWLHGAAMRVAPRPEDLPQSLVGKINVGFGRAPAELAQYLTAMRWLGAARGAGLIGGLQEADQGWEAAAIGAGKAALLGKAAEALAPLTSLERAAGLGSLGAASSVGQGSSFDDVIDDGVVYALLGAAGIPKARQPNLLPLRTAYDEFVDAARHAENRLDVIRGLTPRRRRQEIVRINNAPGVLLEDVARASDGLLGYKVKPGGKYDLPPLPGLRESRIYDYRRTKWWRPMREVEVKRERARYPKQQRRADERLEEQEGVRIDRRRENEILRRARIELGKEGRFDQQGIELGRLLRRQMRKRPRPD